MANNLPAALGIALSAIVCRSSLSCNQSARRLRRSAVTKARLNRRPREVMDNLWGRRFAYQRRATGAVALQQVVTVESRSSHIDARAGVDLDLFAFLDKERDVDGLTGFQSCRLCHIARRVASQSLRGLGHLQAYRRG